MCLFRSGKGQRPAHTGRDLPPVLKKQSPTIANSSVSFIDSFFKNLDLPPQASLLVAKVFLG